MLPLLFFLFCGLAQGGDLENGLLQQILPHDFFQIYHNVAFEYHDTANILLVESWTECYFLRLDGAMEQQLMNTTTRGALMAKIYAQIQEHTGEVQSTVFDLGLDVHDYRAAWQCALRQVYELTLQQDPVSTDGGGTDDD